MILYVCVRVCVCVCLSPRWSARARWSRTLYIYIYIYIICTHMFYNNNYTLIVYYICIDMLLCITKEITYINSIVYYIYIYIYIMIMIIIIILMKCMLILLPIIILLMIWLLLMTLIIIMIMICVLLIETGGVPEQDGAVLWLLDAPESAAHGPPDRIHTLVRTCQCDNSENTE